MQTGTHANRCSHAVFPAVGAGESPIVPFQKRCPASRKHSGGCWQQTAQKLGDMYVQCLCNKRSFDWSFLEQVWVVTHLKFTKDREQDRVRLPQSQSNIFSRAEGKNMQINCKQHTLRSCISTPIIPITLPPDKVALVLDLAMNSSYRNRCLRDRPQ